MIGVGLSLIILIFRTSRPYVAELGNKRGRVRGAGTGGAHGG